MRASATLNLEATTDENPSYSCIVSQLLNRGGPDDPHDLTNRHVAVRPDDAWTDTYIVVRSAVEARELAEALIDAADALDEYDHVHQLAVTR